MYRTDTGTGLFKIHKTRTPRKSGRMGSRIVTVKEKHWRIKRSVREHDCWLLSSAKFKMSGTVPPLPHVAMWPAQRQFQFYVLW